MSDAIETKDQGQTSQPAGNIHDVGMLDLRYAKTPEDLAGIKSISDVGLLLVPEHLAGALNRIPTSDIGGIVWVPQDRNVTCMTGQIRLSAESLASGDADTILIIAGQAIFTGEIKSIGYAEIRIVGQALVPRSGQEVFTAKLRQMTGQCMYGPSNARVVLGRQEITEEFLELLPEPTAFFVLGELVFGNDVSKDLLRAKIPEIALMGAIRAPQHLISLLEVLTVERMGQISVR